MSLLERIAAGRACFVRAFVSSVSRCVAAEANAARALLVALVHDLAVTAHACP